MPVAALGHESVTCRPRFKSATRMPKPLHVSLVAIPEASISTLHGIYDVLAGFGLLRGNEAIPDAPPFAVEIVGAQDGAVTLASGLATRVHRGAADLEDTEVVIVPSVVLPAAGWRTGRYRVLTDWLKKKHARGATLCSACSGAFLIAETGLLDGRDITVHWGYAARFKATFPRVVLHPERSLVVAGERGDEPAVRGLRPRHARRHARR